MSIFELSESKKLSESKNAVEPNKPGTVVTSWDDGWILDLEVARLLRKYKVKGTFFIISRNISQEGRLDENDVNDLAAHFEIGAHTATHPRLTNLSFEEAERDINEGKDELEAILNRKIEVFCYPYGKFNQKIISLVKQAGFLGARTTRCLNTQNGKDCFQLPTTIALQPISPLKIAGKVLRYGVREKFAGTSVALRNANKSLAELSKEYIDYVRQNGGVFHIWGHSLDVRNFELWDELEDILAYVAAAKNVKYATVGELIEARRC